MNKEDYRIKKVMPLLKCGLILIWYYLSNLLISSAVYAALNDWDRYSEYVQNYQSKLLIVIYLVLFLGVWAFDQHKQKFIGTFAKWRLKKVIQYILMGIGAYIVSNIITAFLLPYFPEYEEIGAIFNQNQIILTFIGTVILAPLVEEYLFRHKIQGYLKETFNTQLAIIIQAIIFGMLHGFIIQKIYAMLIGAFFGFINEKEKSMQPSIVMHMVVNGIGWMIGCFLMG